MKETAKSKDVEQIEQAELRDLTSTVDVEQIEQAELRDLTSTVDVEQIEQAELPELTSTVTTVEDNSVGQLNSPSFNTAAPTVVQPPVAPQDVEVITVNRKLQDVQQQVYIFEGKPHGKYILEYHHNGTVMPLPVFWTGTELLA